MNRRVLFLSLLLFLSCSKNSDETTPPVVGRWTLVAQQDGTGAWVNFIPFVPVQFEFRSDGTFDYVEPNGKPQRGCCQPTRYSLKAGSLLIPSSSSQWVPTTVTFTDWVSCPNVNCAPIRTWTVLQVSDQFLDLDLSEGKTPAQHFRYQRVR